MIKAIIFDWFGVVCNKAYAEWAGKNAANELMLKELMSLADRVDAGKLSLSEFRQAVGKLVNQSPEQVRQGIEEFVWLDGQVIALIRRLKVKYRVAVLSNINAEFLTEVIKRKGLLNAFDLVLASSSVGIVKPNPMIFRIILGKLNCLPGNAVFIDDTPSHVGVAKSLGFKGIVFKSAYQLELELKAILAER